MSRLTELKQRCVEESSKVLVGLEHEVEQVLVCLLCEGHLLLEGVPGLAKTLIARTFARLLGGEFSRVQFTADLMPSDIVGTSLFDLGAREFKLREGPVFTNVLLAYEINRAPAKTQSALLEAMQEGQVSVDGETLRLPSPFLVLATQNPVEQEGTYPLPEASLDRFFLRIVIPYPSPEREVEILERHTAGIRSLDEPLNALSSVLDQETLEAARKEITDLRVDRSLLEYTVAISAATRDSPDVLLGASPRASIALLLAARALAGLRGAEYLTPDEIRDLVAPALAHRVILDPSAELDGLDPRTVVEHIASQVPVPR